MIKENSKMQKRSFGTTMGITSIIAILVILVLVVFSTLSLVTAKADLSLAQRTSDSILNYYNADSDAVMITSEFGKMISTGEVPATVDPESLTPIGKAFANGKNYDWNSSTGIFKFSTAIDGSRELKVEVKYDKSGNVTETNLWQVNPVGEWEQDNDMNLYQPPVQP